MQIFTQLVLTIGRITQNVVEMIGTGFLISTDGKVATTRHMIGADDTNLVILMPHINDINSYQDLSDTSCNPIPAKVIEVDPIKDISILQMSIQFNGLIPEIGSIDEVSVGDEIGIFGFPHCTEGRRALTFQKTIIGAKILLDTKGIKSKHAVLNTQTRPGQSGSLIFSQKNNKIIGVLIGAYAPNGGGISLGGINPRELHQTTYCISAEYLKEMI